MTNMNIKYVGIILFVTLILTACSAEPQSLITYDPDSLNFDKQNAFALQGQFASQFPNRSSGQPNNHLAAEWIEKQMIAYGWSCQIDTWTVINYSVPVAMNNVVCTLPGESNKEILVVAHLDQASTTIEGADNDASGIAILLELGKVFYAEKPLPYSLAYVATDGEEYGMLGTRRYLQTHAMPDNIIAGISLDNVGKALYTGLKVEVVGQFRKYGQIWLPLMAQDVAEAAGDLWTVQLRAPIDQILDQAVPISFMDQGPMVALGIPSIGFAGVIPPESAELSWSTYHTPLDTMEYESADTLYHAGRIPEALIRQLLSMQSFPNIPGPYLYFEASHQLFRGPALYSLFIGFTAIFFVGAVSFARTDFRTKLARWASALPHFLSLWLPLVASLLVLYLLVALGLMDKYAVYPGTTKDPVIVTPHWPAVIIFLASLVAFYFFSRRILQRFVKDVKTPSFGVVKSLAFMIVGLGALYFMIINPFSLLFLVPTLFWFLITGRKGAWRLLDIVLLLFGLLIVFALIYFFGFVIQRSNLAVLWYLMMMFSIK
ncbi:MAG: hypothetical protein C3F13_13850 [Anaerolineales bacterium]|nr:Zn-dependent exopeptidase M28 [Anaerolineae bacterium]PWB51515.1 MAG: hypothetical protein C3F13_13850 [Anaerolineales bacterium]